MLSLVDVKDGHNDVLDRQVNYQQREEVEVERGEEHPKEFVHQKQHLVHFYFVRLVDHQRILKRCLHWEVCFGPQIIILNLD